MALTPSGKTLHPMLEGSLSEQPGQLNIYSFDLETRSFTNRSALEPSYRYRLEPEATAIGAFKMFSESAGLVLERDSGEAGDALFKKVYRVDFNQLDEQGFLLKREVADLKARSFLIAEADPFIVVPLFMLRYRGIDAYAPTIGDYAVVLHGDRVFPAIVGDAGPTFQAGEASLRMAKEINEKAGVYSRPVSDLSVSYLVFPGSAESTKGPPDLEQWHERCQALLDGLGGLGPGVSLHHWEDTTKAAVAPEVQPAPELEPGEAPPAS